MPTRLEKNAQVSLSMIQPHSPLIAHEAHDHNHNLLYRLNHSEQRYPIPTPASSQSDNRTASASTSMTGADEGKNDGGGCDAESDNKETDDEHEDDVAPSDSANILGDDQAGHTHEERARQKRKRSGSLQRENLATKGPSGLERSEMVEEAEEISDADDYAGVDLISDSEEVDGSIEKLEESIIIASEESRWDNLTPAPDFSPRDWNPNGWDIFALGGDPFFADTNVNQFNEEYGRTGSLIFSDDAALHNSTVIVRDQSPLASTRSGHRQVRFADSLSLPHGSSLDKGSGSSPDIPSSSYRRVDDRTLNPQRGKISKGVRKGCGFSQKNSRNSQVGPKKHQNRRGGISPLDLSFGGSDSSSSGYDNFSADLGETTEEDENLLHRSQSLRRRASRSSLRHKRPQAPIPLHRPSQTGRRIGPPMGSWVATSSKPIAMMNKTCTSLLIFRISKEVQTKQRTSNRVATNKNLASNNTFTYPSFSISYPSFASDGGYSMNDGDLGASSSSRLEYAARFSRLIEPVVIPPQLLHKNPAISGDSHRSINDLTSPASYHSLSEWSHEEGFSQCEESGENQGEPIDIDYYLDFSNDLEESGDDDEHLAAMIPDSSPSTGGNSQNMPIETQSSQNLLNHIGQGLATALHRDEYPQVPRTPFHLEDDTLDPLDFAVDHGRYATNSASKSPEMRPLKKRRMSDGPSRAESISRAKAALAAMS